ncbi:RDD family protein [Streptomyces sp. M19]
MPQGRLTPERHPVGGTRTRRATPAAPPRTAPRTATRGPRRPVRVRPSVRTRRPVRLRRAASRDAPLASLGRRLLARIVDGLIIGIPVSVVMSLAMGATTRRGRRQVDRHHDRVRHRVLPLRGIMLTTSGQTVGKRLTRIRVAMLDDGRVPSGSPGWMRAGVYALPEIVPCCGFVFWLVNVLWCTWDRPYRQCLHDKAARTVVVSAPV